MHRLEQVAPDVAKAIRQETERQARNLPGITVNENTVPFETRSPMVTSGFRIGTPAVTTRGMREAEMDAIADLIDRVLRARGDARAEGGVRADVAAFTARFPLYPERLK
jgi:glycine hydroxymethyltransferase